MSREEEPAWTTHLATGTWSPRATKIQTACGDLAPICFATQDPDRVACRRCRATRAFEERVRLLQRRPHVEP